MNGLASVLQSLNELKQSEELFRKLLEFQKVNLLPDNPKNGDCINNLAKVLKSQNLLKQSEELYR